MYTGPDSSRIDLSIVIFTVRWSFRINKLFMRVLEKRQMFGLSCYCYCLGQCFNNSFFINSIFLLLTIIGAINLCAEKKHDHDC